MWRTLKTSGEQDGYCVAKSPDPGVKILEKESLNRKGD